jgi:hypothetical protein
LEEKPNGKRMKKKKNFGLEKKTKPKKKEEKK